MNCFVFVIKLFYFEVTVDFHAVIKNNRESPCILYPVSPKGNILQSHTIPYQKQDTDTDIVKKQHISPGSSHCPFVVTPTSLHPHPLLTPGNH